MDISCWRRPRQERLQRGWAGRVRRGCDASQGKAGDADRSAKKLPPRVVGMEACRGAHHLVACSLPTATTFG